MKQNSKFYTNEINKQIILNCHDDITAFDTYMIQVNRPDGKVVEWEAAAKTLDGKPYYLEYFTHLGDFDIPGRYRLQAVVGNSVEVEVDGKMELVFSDIFYGETVQILVYDLFN